MDEVRDYRMQFYIRTIYISLKMLCLVQFEKLQTTWVVWWFELHGIDPQSAQTKYIYRHSIYKWEITCIKYNFSCKTLASFKCKASLIQNKSVFGLPWCKNLLKDLMNLTFSSLQIKRYLLLLPLTWFFLKKYE